MILKKNFPDMTLVDILKKGDSFGQIALETSSVRTATVVARTDVHFAVLNEATYKRHVQREKYLMLKEKISFLQTMGIFHDWSPFRLHIILSCCSEQTLTINQYVYRSGDPIDYVYFI